MLARRFVDGVVHTSLSSPPPNGLEPRWQRAASIVWCRVKEPAALLFEKSVLLARTLGGVAYRGTDGLLHPLCQDFVGLLVAFPWICFHIFLTTLCRLRVKRVGDTRQRIEPSSPRCPMGTRSGELPLACGRSPARAAPHKRSGTCAVRFRTCLYQTSAQLTARGRGAKFSMKSTEKLLHPAPGEHTRRDDPQANPLDFRIKLIIMN